jgi:hypothetical protein
MKDPNAVKKEPPTIIKTFSSLHRGRQEYRVRVVKYSTSPRLLDLREFIQTPTESLFTKKGVSLGYDQVLALYKLLPEILDSLNPKLNKSP